MATAAEISSRRKEDAKYCLLEWAKLTGALTSTQFTLHGATISTYVSGADGVAGDKVKALKSAIAIVAAAGHAVPNMRVYLSSDTGVSTIAYVGTATGGVDPMVFLGGKAGKHSCKGKDTMGLNIPGGVSAAGRERGIADQRYDGTTRWFGNPKRLALMETTVIHELGHVLHEQHDPSTFWDLKASVMPLAVAQSGWLNAAMQVSQYATKGPLEFVAEVFAGRLTGKVFPAAVNTAYAAANGP